MWQNTLLMYMRAMCVRARVFVYFFVSYPLSPSPSRWLSHSLNVQAGMSPFPRDGPDLTTVRPTPNAGNKSH